MEVEAVRTPLSLAAVEQTFRAYGVPSKAVPILTALVAIENARGQSIFNHNWGNITVASPDASHWKAPDNPRLFGAYGDHMLGAQALLHRLTASPTHRRMWDAAVKGDVKGFVHGMVTPHPQTKMMYCDTCPPGPTLKAYQSLVRELGGSSSGGSSGFELLLGIALPVAGLGVALWRWTR